MSETPNEQPLSAVPVVPTRLSDVGETDEQWSAVINIHDANLAQIEAALAANQHEVDPHPSGQPGRYVKRHPVYIVAVNYSELDDEGHPTPGKPAELDLTAVRGIFAARYPNMVIEDDPPADGSHVRIRDSHVVAEKDSVGNPTGRVIFGTAEDVE
jgi:hypothetical protein